MDSEKLAHALGRMEAKLETMHDDILDGRATASSLSSRIASLEHFRTWVKGGAALAVSGVALAAKAKGLF